MIFFFFSDVCSVFLYFFGLEILMPGIFLGLKFQACVFFWVCNMKHRRTPPSCILRVPPLGPRTKDNWGCLPLHIHLNASTKTRRVGCERSVKHFYRRQGSLWGKSCVITAKLTTISVALLKCVKKFPNLPLSSICNWNFPRSQHSRPCCFWRETRPSLWERGWPYGNISIMRTRLSIGLACCKTYGHFTQAVTSTTTGENQQRPTCQTSNVMCLIECSKCNNQCIGETRNPIHRRAKQHRSDINAGHKNIPTVRYFKNWKG